MVQSNWSGQYGQVAYQSRIVTTKHSIVSQQAPYTTWFPMNGQHTGQHGALVLASYGFTPDAFLPYPIERACLDIPEFHVGFTTEEPVCSAEKARERGNLLSDNQEQVACAGMTQVLIARNSIMQQWRATRMWMPMWVFGYRFNGTHYRVVVDGVVRRVHGNRPSFRDRIGSRKTS